jgi:hypothetical protein
MVKKSIDRYLCEARVNGLFEAALHPGGWDEQPLA